MYDKESIQMEELSIDGGAKRSQATPTTTNTKTQASLGVRIKKGKSIIALSNLVTREEIDYVVKLSLEAATDQTIKDTTSGRVCVRMPTAAAAQRQDIPDTDNLHDPLPQNLSQFLQERILERVFHYIDQELCPTVKKTLFGEYHDISTLFESNALEWSNREPAINVYYPPDGHFGLHKDNKALTILMPLTSRDDTDDGDVNNDDDEDCKFTGGGTAFWSQSHPKEGIDAPSLVMAPKAGTALLFGGQVHHKGLSIQSGNRVVFVASFSKKLKKKANTWMVSAR